MPEEAESAIVALLGLPDLKEAIIEPECNRRTIEKDCVSRWNSIYLSLLSFMETRKLRDAAAALCPETWAGICWEDHKTQFAAWTDSLNTEIAGCDTSIASYEKKGGSGTSGRPR